MRAMSVVLVLSCMVATVVAAKAAKAAEGQQAEQLQAVAIAKAKAEAAVNVVSPAADGVKSGYSVLYGDTQDVYSKAIQSLQKIINDESAKPAADQNAALLQKAKEQAALIADELGKYTGKVYPLLASRQSEARSSADSVGMVFNALSSLEIHWKNGKVDMAALKTAYEAVEKGAQELTEVLKTILAEHQQELKKGQALAAEARAAVATQPAK